MAIMLTADPLPDMSRDDIMKLAKTTEDPKAINRLRVCSMRKDGYSLYDITKALFVPPTTIHRWIKQIKEKGLEGLHDKKQPGAKPKLTEKQRQRLYNDLTQSPQKFGFASGLWTGPLIQEHIRKKYNVEYVLRTVDQIVHDLGFTYRKPRPVNPDTPSDEVKEAFKKNAQEIVDLAYEEGRSIFCIDERHCRLKQTPGRGWLPKSEDVTVDVPTSNKEKMTIIGAVGMDSFHMRFYDAGNMDTFEKFLRELYAEAGPYVAFADNVSYHSKKVIKKLHDETDGGIAVEFLPPRSPELNPAEPQWREQIRHTSGAFFENMSKLKRFLRRGHRQGTIKKVKMYDFYIPKKLKG